MKKPKEKTIALEFGEHMVAVVPELCSGPGWSNAPIWVYIERKDGTLRTECIQPTERTPDLHALFMPGAAMCRALLAAVKVSQK